MKEGKPHGTATEWYADGTKKSSTIYRHGLREGPSSEWYRTGQQKLEQTFLSEMISSMVSVPFGMITGKKD